MASGENSLAELFELDVIGGVELCSEERLFIIAGKEKRIRLYWLELFEKRITEPQSKESLRSMLEVVMREKTVDFCDQLFKQTTLTEKGEEDE